MTPRKLIPILALTAALLPGLAAAQRVEVRLDRRALGEPLGALDVAAVLGHEREERVVADERRGFADDGVEQVGDRELILGEPPCRTLEAAEALPFARMQLVVHVSPRTNEPSSLARPGSS